MTKQATRTDTPAGTKERDAHAGAAAGSPGPARITGGRARLRVAGLPLDLEHDVSRDVRARRPNIVNALIQARALERAARVAVAARDRFRRRSSARSVTALALKAIVRGDFVPREICHTALDYHDVRVPRDGAAVRAQRPLQPSRGAAGPRRDRRRPLRGGVRLARVRARERARLQLVLHLLRRPVLRADLGECAALALRARDRAGAARARPAASHDPGRFGQADRCGRARRSCPTPSPTRYEPVGYISLTPKPDNGLRNLGSLQELPHLLDRAPRTGGDHRRPGLPAGRGVRARRPLPRARGRGADRAHDDGDPDPPARAGARSDGAAVRAQAAGLRGHRLRDQADLRLRRGDRPADRAVARCCWRSRPAIKLTSTRPGAVPQPPRRDRRPAVRLPQVPHDAHGRRAAPGGARGDERGERRAVQDPQRPAGHRRSAGSCAASASTSCRSS